MFAYVIVKEMLVGNPKVLIGHPLDTMWHTVTENVVVLYFEVILLGYLDGKIGQCHSS